MTRYEIGDLLGNIGIVLAAIPLHIFVLIYAIRYPWRQFLAGRALMYFAIGFILVIDQICLSIWVAGYDGRWWIRPLLYFVIGYGSWRMLATLIHLAHRREELVPTWGLVPDYPPRKQGAGDSVVPDSDD